jgi:UDP-N-acetylmuramoyl-L-alanyl-D-glutamate--2,6-diaminopimelate ligase
VASLAAVLEQAKILADEPLVLAGSNSSWDLKEITISGVAMDSLNVTDGTLFVCVSGEVHDGHNYAHQAVASGAVALVVERPLGLGVAEIVVESSRTAVGWLAAAFHNNPSAAVPVIGITGTNGKTTTVHLLAEIFRHAGKQAAQIGTLTGARTTPEAPDLQALLATERDAGADMVAMEVSSHALAQRRVNGVQFTIAAFTNLSLDHLDYHHTFEEYFEAKASLFQPSRTALSVIDVGTAMGRKLAERVATEVIEVSVDDVDDLTLFADRSNFVWRGKRITLPLGGRFNVANAVVAATCASLLGLSDEQIVDGLGAIAAVPGRFESIPAGKFSVVVDYAHTPDGLLKVLSAARELTSGEVWVVFGAGGDRDRSKRPEMGRVAADNAHRVVVTSDNPRSEVPAQIIEEIMAGIPESEHVRVEADRRAAISLALHNAAAGDVVVIAGKGHETTQTTGPVVADFDDRVVARQILLEMEIVA